MVVDGKLIARELRTALQARVQKETKGILSLGLVVAEETPEIRAFVRLKEAFGKDMGVRVEAVYVDHLHEKTEDFLQLLLHTAREHDGLIVQLPLPAGLDLESVLRLFPMSHDVDVLGHTAFQQYKEGVLPFEPPVIGAMMEVLHRSGVHIAGLRTLVIGEGRLVGEPASIWTRRMGAVVKIANKESDDIEEWARGADLIICGAGAPGIIHPGIIKEGVIILDAGTSEMQGVLKGDADPACAEKASIFTPTPGGIGPITVAKVFENLLELAKLKARRTS